MSILRPNIAHSPALVTFEDRQEMLRVWERRLRGIFEETPVSFPRFPDFTLVIPGKPELGMELSSEPSMADDGEDQYGASVAQHMGRKIQKDQL